MAMACGSSSPPITLVLYPMMLVAYVRLARREERDSFARFGPRHAAYMQDVPAFLPLRSHATQTSHPPH